jgi:hypothetical protein
MCINATSYVAPGARTATAPTPIFAVVAPPKRVDAVVGEAR